MTTPTATPTPTTIIVNPITRRYSYDKPGQPLPAGWMRSNKGQRHYVDAGYTYDLAAWAVEVKQ